MSRRLPGEKGSKRIFISSPLRGDVEANRQKARAYAIEVIKMGHLPVLPHYAFEYLADYYPHGGLIAMYLCCRETLSCDEVWCFENETDGMGFEIAYAKGMGIPVKDGNKEIKGDEQNGTD